MLLSAVSGLTACGGEHSHDNLDAVAKKDATCTEAGYEAYYKCPECDKIFSDAKGENEITAPVAIAAGHKIEKVNQKDATCIALGAKAHYKCKACDALFSDEAGTHPITEVETIPMADHTIVSVPMKRPLCTEDGYEEHYKCSYCSKLFEDEEGTTPIDEPVVIPAAHRIEAVPKKEATCIEDGYEAHYKCKVCETLYSDENGANVIQTPVVIAKTPDKHTIGFDYTKDTAPVPAETGGGQLTQKCLVCGKEETTVNYDAGFSMETVTPAKSLKMKTVGTYYITLGLSGKTNSYFSFHVAAAGTYKLTFTEVFSQDTLTRMFQGIWIAENAYVTSATNNLWAVASNSWSTTASLQDTINKYKDKIVRDETTADYSSALGPRTTLNSITLTFEEADIPEGGLYITLQTTDKVYDPEKKVANPTEPGTYLIKFEAPQEQTEAPTEPTQR